MFLWKHWLTLGHDGCYTVLRSLFFLLVIIFNVNLRHWAQGQIMIILTQCEAACCWTPPWHASLAGKTVNQKVWIRWGPGETVQTRTSQPISFVTGLAENLTADFSAPEWHNICMCEGEWCAGLPCCGLWLSCPVFSAHFSSRKSKACKDGGYELIMGIFCLPFSRRPARNWQSIISCSIRRKVTCCWSASQCYPNKDTSSRAVVVAALKM